MPPATCKSVPRRVYRNKSFKGGVTDKYRDRVALLQRRREGSLLHLLESATTPSLSLSEGSTSGRLGVCNKDAITWYMAVVSAL